MTFLDGMLIVSAVALAVAGGSYWIFLWSASHPRKNLIGLSVMAAVGFVIGAGVKLRLGGDIAAVLAAGAWAAFGAVVFLVLMLLRIEGDQFQYLAVRKIIDRLAASTPPRRHPALVATAWVLFSLLLLGMLWWVVLGMLSTIQPHVNPHPLASDRPEPAYGLIHEFPLLSRRGVLYVGWANAIVFYVMAMSAGAVVVMGLAVAIFDRVRGFKRS